jgi:tRNA-dihydrouridine synthase B
MVPSEAVVRYIPRAFQLMEKSKKEKNLVIQIFGNDPKTMASAAKIIEEKVKPQGIDINFGCSVIRAKRNEIGAYLLDDSDKVVQIVKEVKKNIKIPLSVKIRLTRYDIVDLVKQIKPYIDVLTVHGRYSSQGFKGSADYTEIYRIKKEFPNLIVLGNGDIRSPKDFKEKIKNLDGVLLGRVTKSNKNIFKQIKDNI